MWATRPARPAERGVFRKLAPMMIAGMALALVAAQGGDTGRVDAPLLRISGPKGEMVKLCDLHGRSLVITPFATLADTVQRAGLIRGQFVLEFDGVEFSSDSSEYTPSVTAIVHGKNDLVVLEQSITPPSPKRRTPSLAVFSDMTVPRRVDGGGNGGVEWVVRRDFEAISGERLRISPPDTPFDSLLVFGVPPVDGLHRPLGLFDVDGSPLNILDPSASSAVVFTLGDTGEPTMFDFAMDRLVDAAYYATRTEPKKSVPLASERDLEMLRWRFDFPAELRDELERNAITLVIETGQGQGDLGVLARTIDANLDSLAQPPLEDFTPSRRGEIFEGGTRGLEFMHFEGPREQLDIRPTMGPGAAWGDLNEDGWLDIVVLQGAGDEHTDPLPDRVWLGGENGQFTDVTDKAGLASGDAGMGALLVDLNGDGHLDLYCANYGVDRLFLGKGDGTFDEATDLLPGHDLWSASVVAGDPDGDGDLDLYVTSYLDYDESKMPAPEELGRYQREDPIAMLPFAFPGARNVYLRNTLESGELGFEDATEELGLLDASGRGMQAVFWDFDYDGDEDLYIANDVSPNVLFRNEGDGTFKDVSFSTGLDDPRGGMGLALGDVDQDGDDDMFLTNWQLEANALYLNGHIRHGTGKRRRSSFHDSTVQSGLGPSGIGKTSWGAELFDLELDGDLDLFVANGYTSPDYESTGICVGQRDLFYVGNGKGEFRNASALATDALARPLASRGAIGADYDRDGDIDLAITANNGRLQLLTNIAEHRGKWLGLRLRQRGPNRYAIGARVLVTTSDGRTRSATLRAGHGYLTGNPPELHFGLGDVEGLEGVSVTWPDGDVSEFSPQVDQWTTLSKPE